jgi:hypothetical protein
VASERGFLVGVLGRALGEIDMFRRATPLVEAVLAEEAAKQARSRTLEHERTTTSAVKQLRNDLKDEKTDAEDQVWGLLATE